MIGNDEGGLLTLYGAMGAEAAPRAYVMKCKGGGDMSIDLRQLPKTVPPLEIIINFKKARDHRNLRAGECSWLDRKIRKGEPRRLWFTVRFGTGIDRNLFFGRSLKRIIWRTKGKNLSRIETTIGPINRLLARANGGKEFFVHVFNSVNWANKKDYRAFIVTKIGT